MYSLSTTFIKDKKTAPIRMSPLNNLSNILLPDISVRLKYHELYSKSIQMLTMSTFCQR